MDSYLSHLFRAKREQHGVLFIHERHGGLFKLKNATSIRFGSTQSWGHHVGISFQNGSDLGHYQRDWNLEGIAKEIDGTKSGHKMDERFIPLNEKFTAFRDKYFKLPDGYLMEREHNWYVEDWDVKVVVKKDNKFLLLGFRTDGTAQFLTPPVSYIEHKNKFLIDGKYFVDDKYIETPQLKKVFTSRADIRYVFSDNSSTLKESPNTQRFSVEHYGLTDDNIFYHQNEYGFGKTIMPDVRFVDIMAGAFFIVDSHGQCYFYSRDKGIRKIDLVLPRGKIAIHKSDTDSGFMGILINPVKYTGPRRVPETYIDLNPKEDSYELKYPPGDILIHSIPELLPPVPKGFPYFIMKPIKCGDKICHAVKKDGTSCTNKAKPESCFCGVHKNQSPPVSLQLNTDGIVELEKSLGFRSWSRGDYFDVVFRERLYRDLGDVSVLKGKKFAAYWGKVKRINPNSTWYDVAKLFGGMSFDKYEIDEENKMIIFS